MYPTTITHITFIYSLLGVSPKRLNDYVMPTGSVGSVAVGGKSGAGVPLCRRRIRRDGDGGVFRAPRQLHAPTYV